MIILAHRVGSQLVYFEPIYDGYLEKERLRLNTKETQEMKVNIKDVEKKAKELKVQTNADHFYDTYLLDKSSFEKKVIAEVENQKNDFINSPCFQPWYLMGIKGSGLAGCCSTFETGEYIHDKTLKEVWFGKTFEKLRKEMLMKKLPNYCSKCSVVVMKDNRRLREGLKQKMSVKGKIMNSVSTWINK